VSRCVHYQTLVEPVDVEVGVLEEDESLEDELDDDSLEDELVEELVEEALDVDLLSVL
jgi:hypothetical protein